MKKSFLVPLLLLAFFTSLTAKEQVFYGDQSIKSKETAMGMLPFDITYKVSIFMGDPLVQVKGRFTLPYLGGFGGVTLKDGNTLNYSDLPQSVKKNLDVYNVKARFTFTSPNFHGKLYFEEDLGAFNGPDEYSYNTPGSKNWNDFLKNHRGVHLSSSDAKEAYKTMSLHNIEIIELQTNTISAEHYHNQKLKDKKIQQLKDASPATMTQNEVDDRRAYLQDKKSMLEGDKFAQKERLLKQAIEQAKKQNDPQNVALFEKKLRGLYKAEAHINKEFKSLDKEEQRVVALGIKIDLNTKKYDKRAKKLQEIKEEFIYKKKQKINALNNNPTLNAKIDQFMNEKEKMLREQGQKSLGYVSTDNAYIEIEYWDHGEEDGDEVKIYNNGDYLKRLYLENDHNEIELTLNNDINEIVIKSVDNGRSGKNTASFIVKNKDKIISQKEWNLEYLEKAVLTVIKF